MLRRLITRMFRVIHIDEAKQLGLKFVRNVEEDELKWLICGSIWEDDKKRLYRVQQIVRT